ncbi:unnamed protein product [Amaranthus hypochondriacus]
MASSEQAIVATSPQGNQTLEFDSQFASVLYDLSQQVQAAMEDLLNTIKEIDVHSAEVTEEMERCKQSAMERRKAIEQEKECFQKAAYAVLDVLNIADSKQMFLESGSEY